MLQFFLLYLDSTVHNLEEAQLKKDFIVLNNVILGLMQKTRYPLYLSNKCLCYQFDSSLTFNNVISIYT